MASNMRSQRGDRRSASGPPTSRAGGLRSAVLAGAAGFAAALGIGGVVAYLAGLQRSSEISNIDRTSLVPKAAPKPSATQEPAKAEPPPPAPSASSSSNATSELNAPYSGPLLGATVPQAPVFATQDLDGKRIGYIRLGGKVPVDPTPTKNSSCPKGWYRVVDGGFVCGKHGTLDLKSPQVRLGIVAPNLDDILPYKYAHNSANGTPLYRAVPSREEMLAYEPWLDAAKRARSKTKAAEDEPEKPEENLPVTTSDAAPKDKDLTDSSALLDAAPVAVEAPPKPWWEQNEPGKPLNITLAELEKDSDGTVAKRMVKGFFVAVDKTFRWSNRLWYKTTSGLVAPSDRMVIVKPPSTKGVEFSAGVSQLGFSLSPKAQRYELDEDRKKATPKGSLERHSAFGLTGETATIKSTVYRETTEGFWMKAIDGTYTDPGPPPPDLAPGEKWVDVNLSRKTLVAFEGDRPVYGTVISPGRRSKIKEKDHATRQGTFRIREKHIAITMDGDGTVAGDLPYSIEDVPYVEYYDGSYALHGAFWHDDFGRERSHGCVNLSPLDAKYIFFWTEPQLPRGFHGVYATKEHPGTLVVVHE